MRCSGGGRKGYKKAGKEKHKTRGTTVLYEAESEEDIEEEAKDESESEIEDCIIVHIE